MDEGCTQSGISYRFIDSPAAGENGMIYLSERTTGGTLHWLAIPFEEWQEIVEAMPLIPSGEVDSAVEKLREMVRRAEDNAADWMARYHEAKGEPTPFPVTRRKKEK